MPSTDSHRSIAAAPSASWMRANLSPFKNFKHDLPAGIVVFLVALPLGLGIALASGAPLLSGLISGIVGGIVVSWFTGSPLSVSGPAAGLTVIVLNAIDSLQSWEAFILAVFISGLLQVVLGFARAGLIAYYFPSTVIKGLLAAIGLILILKQIPHAIGFDADPEGEMSFQQIDGRNTFTEIPYAIGHFHLGAALIALVGVIILVAIEKNPKLKFKWLPGPLIVVALGLILNELFLAVAPSLANVNELLVQIPDVADHGLLSMMSFPDFSRLGDPLIYTTAVTLAVVGSIETLLCVEAMDRQDPYKRQSEPNKELKAQGIGNAVAGLIGGLPMTAVIVRGSANVQAGGRTPMASFAHGVLLVVSVLLVPTLMNKIPLAALAAVLLHVGYKLAPIGLFKRMWSLGSNQFIPFIITVLAILFTDLLWGVLIGLAAGTFYILRANLATPYYMHSRQARQEEGPTGKRMHIDIELSENVSFLNKASVSRALQDIPDDARVRISGAHCLYIDRDVLEIIHDFAGSARHRGIEVELEDIPPADAPAKELTARKPVQVGGDEGGIRVDRLREAKTGRKVS